MAMSGAAGTTAPWRQLCLRDKDAATELGWTEDMWSGEADLSEELVAHLCGRKPNHGSDERALADKFGYADGWQERACRLRQPATCQRLVNQLYTRRDGRPGGVTFCGFQLQANAVSATLVVVPVSLVLIRVRWQWNCNTAPWLVQVLREDRLDLSKYVDESTMASQLQFRVCVRCHSALCEGKAAS